MKQKSLVHRSCKGAAASLIDCTRSEVEVLNFLLDQLSYSVSMINNVTRLAESGEAALATNNRTWMRDDLSKKRYGDYIRPLDLCYTPSKRLEPGAKRLEDEGLINCALFGAGHIDAGEIEAVLQWAGSAANQTVDGTPLSESIKNVGRPSANSKEYSRGEMARCLKFDYRHGDALHLHIKRYQIMH